MSQITVTPFPQPKPELRDPLLAALLMYISNFSTELAADTNMHGEHLARLADFAHRILNSGPAVTAFANLANRPGLSDLITMQRLDVERFMAQEEAGIPMHPREDVKETQHALTEEAQAWALICDDDDRDEPFTIRPQLVRDALYRVMDDAAIVGAAVMFELLAGRPEMAGRTRKGGR